jgi:hypothetical protein
MAQDKTRAKINNRPMERERQSGAEGFSAGFKPQKIGAMNRCDLLLQH